MAKYVKNMVRCGILTSVMVVCTWLALPIPPVAVTLQTFGVLLALGLLGGKYGTAVIGLYLLMGMVGLPVFSGFQGGAAVLLGPTGGFLWGFLAGGLVYWLAERWGKLTAMILWQLVCWSCGCLWFCRWAGSGGLWAAFLSCVVPFLVPDGIKLWLAWHLSGRIGKYLN